MPPLNRLPQAPIVMPLLVRLLGVKSFTAAYAIREVCSAGLAITAFPAARLAATCPVKIAKGKFQGEIQRTFPRGAPKC